MLIEVARCSFSSSSRLCNSSGGTGGGYRYFEDHFPQHEPGQSYATWEDQQGAAQVTDETPKKELTESEKLHQLHDWKQRDDGIDIPENFGWDETWGPEPGERGHNDWYKKPREYMSTEEKFKFDSGIATPLKKNTLRHQEMPIHKRMKAAADNLMKEDPKFVDLKAPGKDAEYTLVQKHDTVGKARKEYLDEWLAKPGVEPHNVSLKIAEYNGTAKGKGVKKIPRRPEWELAPHSDPYE